MKEQDLFEAKVKDTTRSGRLKPGHGVPLSDNTPTALKVSASGKDVSVRMESFRLSRAGGGPPQTIKFKPARITSGRFTATGPRLRKPNSAAASPRRRR